MGYPQPAPTRNAGSTIAAFAILSAVALVLLAVLIGFGASVFSRHPDPPVAVAEKSTSPSFTRSYSAADLTVEIDQQGQAYYHGQPLPLEQIKPQIQQAMMHVASNGDMILVVEGCPFEHVEKVIAMYNELGYASPRMATIPPYRTVTVTLDDQGKASIDGEPVEKPQNELQKIVARHGSRAKATIQVDPKCPSQFVVQLTQHCRDIGFGDVQVETAKERVAENSP